MIDFSVFPVLSTERLRLRRLDVSDNDRIFEIFSDEEIMQFYGMFPMSELAEAQCLIERLNKSFDEGNGIRWAIELKEDETLIGTCGFHCWNKRHSRIEIGYELHKEHWRRGYIREAVGKIIEFAFENLDVHRIEAMIYPDNINSMKSLDGLGFEYEGLLKDYVYFREKHQDMKMYSLIR